MGTVLLIEDDAASLELFAYLLRAAGHEVQCAEDGSAGFEAAMAHRPDLILCDIGLPGMSGIDVLARLRREVSLQRVPVVAVTAFAMVGDRQQLLAAGFDGYLPKPIDPDHFAAQVAGYFPEGTDVPRPSPRRRAARAVPRRRPVATKRRRILVLDDSASNLDVVASVLRADGYEVITTQSVSTALSLARQRQPDLLITDLHMEPLDGFSVVEAIRGDDHLRGIRLGVISSSVLTAGEERQVRDLGVAFYLRPFDPERLLAEVDRMLAAGGERGPRPGMPGRPQGA